MDPLLPFSFPLRREGNGRIGRAALADHPPESVAVCNSGGVRDPTAPISVFPSTGIYRIRNAFFRRKGSSALDPEKKSRFFGVACPREEGSPAVFGSAALPSAKGRLTGSGGPVYDRSTRRARATFLANTMGFSTDSKWM